MKIKDLEAAIFAAMLHEYETCAGRKATPEEAQRLRRDAAEEAMYAPVVQAKP